MNNSHCRTPLIHGFLDPGFRPPSNARLTTDDLNRPKTHYLLKALLEKGLVKADNFRRSDNKLAYAYLLTPQGIAAKLELTRAFLRRKEEEHRVVKEEIRRLRKELSEATETGAGKGRPTQLASDIVSR
ncbi:MAG: MarR family EPS-associated transcriptional regulator [Zoogloea oleivorans]|jgi:EPS-associated MarR family transcriptional regulator|uniref:MarR family EPS-associated transcriptional regulator n=1 Tax=Zoogloea oleivorans TaxID=1552750 RepID=UPI002A35FB54|nr:MarR family EPS-associated transcriptional regulator [Zoogloea oleivorans]MDY0038527.1 MarR family EPS-associated transcriptional regulator [Zoogloea oleivorans]